MRTGIEPSQSLRSTVVYSIKDLEKLTGIKAHTIRIWEQRYGLIEPARTETNIRYYTDDNLRHLFNIALLNRQGVKISRIAQLNPLDIASMVAEFNDTQGSSSQIDALTLSMIDLDEQTFNRIFSRFTTENGFERTMIELVYPFLDKLNVLWLTGSINPAHEKFISNLIRRKIICAIENEDCELPKETATFLLYLPETENQELTLLFMYYLLKNRKQKVLYLGAGTSLSDLKEACAIINPSYIFTIINELPYRQSLQQYLNSMQMIAGESTILLTGAQFFTQPVKYPDNSILLNGLQDTILFLDKIKAQQSVFCKNIQANLAN
jgi:MerR family transcriptional regulator, light-induced transcriptional regulator